MFWLDSDHLGWAASPYMSHTFSFVQMGLQDSGPKPLVSRRFEGVQSRLSMESAKQNRLVTLASQWEAGFHPVMGCPFSWSPDSKQIAFADGSEFKIVRVPSTDSRSKR